MINSCPLLFKLCIRVNIVISGGEFYYGPGEERETALKHIMRQAIEYGEQSG